MLCTYVYTNVMTIYDRLHVQFSYKTTQYTRRVLCVLYNYQSDNYYTNQLLLVSRETTFNHGRLLSTRMDPVLCFVLKGKGTATGLVMRPKWKVSCLSWQHGPNRVRYSAFFYSNCKSREKCSRSMYCDKGQAADLKEKSTTFPSMDGFICGLEARFSELESRSNIELVGRESSKGGSSRSEIHGLAVHRPVRRSWP